MACACLYTSRLDTLAEPSKRHGTTKRKIDTNKTGSRSVKTVYLLRGKFRCGYCEQPISAESGASRTGEKKCYYKCHGRKKYKNGCTKTTIKKELLEEFVIEFILGELKRCENIESARTDKRKKPSADTKGR